MVDFGKLKERQKTPRSTDPVELFRRLPKPEGVNDLYTSQASVLEAWYANRSQQDTVIKLHTGGGKTLVGLLAGLSTLYELGAPVLYLVANDQLVNQTIDQARAQGIAVVPYGAGAGVPLNNAFLAGKAIMIGSYQALFNGFSKFGCAGREAVEVGALVLDDAHVAFQTVRDAFTIRVPSDRREYTELAAMFRRSFDEIDRLGTFDDVTTGGDSSVLEVPYWAWHDRLDEARVLLKSVAENAFAWPLVRDDLRLCHALVSSRGFTITPVLPLVHQFPTFEGAARRIYMSATIADDSELVRTFDVAPDAVQHALRSRSLAGVSERMMLIPDRRRLGREPRAAMEQLLDEAVARGVGAVVLVPSARVAEELADLGEVAMGREDVQALVGRLQRKEATSPAILVNRYDGIDLPGDACRVLVLVGLPRGSSDYDLYRGAVLFGSATTARMLAQRIEQGAGRGSRGSGDHCVVVLTGHDLTGWVGDRRNFQFLTSPTRAQLDLGAQVSHEVTGLDDFVETARKCLDRDPDWVEYHASQLADLVHDDEPDESRLLQAAEERKAVRLWRDGFPAKAISKLKKAARAAEADSQMVGWFDQLAARISYAWGDSEQAGVLQREAHARNRNLLRPVVAPPYQQLSFPGEQAISIAKKVAGYHYRPSCVDAFEAAVSALQGVASSNQFEQAMAELGGFLGFAAERHDQNGKGPDVLWVLSDRNALVIEAKSRKQNSALKKDEHGQLLVAGAWFAANYPDHEYLLVSVHPNNRATAVAEAEASYALTSKKLAALVADARELLREVCSSEIPASELPALCSRLLDQSPIRHDRIRESYLMPFVSVRE